MKLNKEDLLLYGVTDSKYLKGRKMSELVEEAILGGVTMIQLREKEMTHEAFKQEVLDVQSVCQKHHVPLIINDDVELCKEIYAEGRIYTYRGRATSLFRCYRSRVAGHANS